MTGKWGTRGGTICGLVALAAVAAGCAGTQLREAVGDVRAEAAQARKSGAMRCAPRELALADSNAVFAERELAEGDYFRAREHLQVAEDSAQAALKMSGPDVCGAGPGGDSDHDGVPNATDKCPNEPEDKDGFEDGDGCPDLDNDKDGIPDATDKCPNEPGPAESGGCPKKYEHIVVTSEKIELKQKIFFETNKSTIKSQSFGLLSEIANVLQTRSTMRIRIEGHTDTQGPRSRNLTLSQARADAVRFHLEGLGVPRARMESVGFGPDQPIETNRTTAGREKNRRVEFVIVQQ